MNTLIRLILLIALAWGQHVHAAGLTHLPAPAAAAPKAQAPSQSLTLGLHVGTWALADYDISGTGFESPDWRGYVIHNLEWIADKGYNTLLLDVMDPEQGTYFFQSRVLAESGYHQGPVVLDYIVEQAHKRRLKIFADHTVLAWRLDDDLTKAYGIGGNKLSVGQVQTVTATLLDKYHFDGIVAETYPARYAKAIYHIAQRYKRQYIHKFDNPAGHADILMSEDYVGFLDSARRARTVEQTGAGANNLGYFNALFGHAKAIGKPGWAKVTSDDYDLPAGASYNVLLLRAVQFQPDGYFWMPGRDTSFQWIRTMDVKRLARHLNRLRTEPDKKPLANFVIGGSGAKPEQDDLEMFLFINHSFGPASNGLMLAGYDLRTTYGDPLPGADLYVLFATGKSGEGARELPDQFLKLLEGDKSVILVTNGIGGSPRWQRALSRLGIRPRQVPEAHKGRLRTVRFRGIALPWSGFPIWEYPCQTALIKPSDVSGKIMLSARVGGTELVLVTKNNNKFLVNGNVLHLDTSFIFNRLVQANLQKPFHGYGIVGRRSAFLAINDTNLAITLPFQRGDEMAVTAFSAIGKVKGREKQTYQGAFQASLEKHELLIIEPWTEANE